MSKQPWQQFHLSTALACLLLTGALIGLNFGLTKGNHYGSDYFYGWPSAVHFPFVTYNYGRWIPVNVAANIVFCVGAILCMCLIMECRIRNLKADDFSIPNSARIHVRPLRLLISMCLVGYLWGKLGERDYYDPLSSSDYIGPYLLIFACLVFCLRLRKTPNPDSSETR